MQNNQPFDILVKTLQIGRTLLQEFESDEKIEVEVKFGKLLRNSNPSLSFVIESDKLSSEMGFWSGSMTGEVVVGNKQSGEVILGYGFTVNSVDEISQHFGKITTIFKENSTPQ